MLGILIGIIASYIVNWSLLEISLNPFFSIYFACIFSSIGLMSLWQAYSNQVEIQEISEHLLKTFGYLVYFQFITHIYSNYLKMIISSGISLILDKNLFVIQHPLAKIPFYGALGIPISFCVVFCFVDVMNLLFICVSFNFTRKMVHTK